MTELTKDLVCRLFCYEPETGILTRKIRTGNNTKEGDVVGTPGGEGYLDVSVNNKKTRVHRVIWLMVHGCAPDYIDHINHNRTDNRLINLREVSRQENQRNMKLHKSNSSGCCGVSYRKQRNKWRAYITVDNKQINLGHFETKEKAIKARKLAEKKYGFHYNHGL